MPNSAYLFEVHHCTKTSQNYQRTWRTSCNEIIVAIITGGVTLAGVLISNAKAQAVTDTKLEERTREVREHNNFARRVPVLEEQMKVANHRIDDLEELNK